MKAGNGWNVLFWCNHDQPRAVSCSRDNGRTPMQWDAGKNSGFTDGTPWLEANRNYPEINAAKQVSCGDSVFSYYKKLIALRKELDVISDGSFEPIENMPDKIFAYRRKLGNQDLLVCASFSNSPEYPPRDIDLSGFRLLLTNIEGRHHFPDYLAPYEAAAYYKDGAAG